MPQPVQVTPYCDEAYDSDARFSHSQSIYNRKLDNSKSRTNSGLVFIAVACLFLCDHSPYVLDLLPRGLF